jgi:hypothetical protein
MSFESDALIEICEAVITIDGPWIDLSDPEKLFMQEMLFHKYVDEPDENFPMGFVYIDSVESEMVANDRFENSVNVDISVVYKIDPKIEKRHEGIERGRRCLQQIVKRILERQTDGKALMPLYLSGNINIEATADGGIDHDKESDLINGAATAKFTLRQLQQEEQNA